MNITKKVMILVVDDDQAVSTSISLLLRNAGYKYLIVSSPQEALEFLQDHSPALVVLDMNFSVETSGDEGIELLKVIKTTYPSLPVILLTGWGSISLAVKGMKLGAVDFITKPWDNEFLLQSIYTSLIISEQPEEKHLSSDRKNLDEKYKFENIVGNDPSFLSILRSIGRVSPTEASVLIQGESGTGKELIAEAIHQNSLRKNRAFVKVNLGGISSSLFESEMFGHKKGAFTDARSDRVGRFELADKGTIFLDEIGDLHLSNQVKLLRVLQDRTYEVLGDSKTRSVDVRVICATNKNLQSMVDNGEFREDLYYRINLITVKLPSLRERSGDIPLLVDFFLQNLKNIYQRKNLKISKSAMKWLKGLPLSGNIRELKNLVERTVLISSREILDVDDFVDQAQQKGKKSIEQVLPGTGIATLEEMEKFMIFRAMEHHKSNMTRVARSLGISRGALYRRLDKYNIPYEATD